jgi:hypothetical protein
MEVAAGTEMERWREGERKLQAPKIWVAGKIWGKLDGGVSSGVLMGEPEPESDEDK